MKYKGRVESLVIYNRYGIDKKSSLNYSYCASTECLNEIKAVMFNVYEGTSNQ